MSTTFEFDGKTPHGLVEAFEALPPALNSHLESAADDIGVRIAGAARENATVDRGRLRASISHVVENVGETLMQIRVGTNVDYAEGIEEGRDPHWPDMTKLRGWAHRVLGDESAAVPVGRKIAQEGTDAQPYLRPAFNEHLEWVLDRINSAVEAAFEEVDLA